jgi:hypothetical protein
MFHQEQIEAAQAILSAYSTLALFYAVLVSLTQAGKTGTFHKLIHDMFTEGKIQRAYILCGSSETELRSQAIEDAIEHNRGLVESGKLKVIFHQDFKKEVMNTCNALIVVDESHLDQSQGQQLHQFLFRHGITMDGNPAPLKDNNTYILSVDATPYSELAALTHKETVHKKHVQLLKPGVNYYGLADYDRDGYIMPTFDILECKSIFADLIGERGNKWSLIRLPPSTRGTEEKKAIEAICRTRGYKVVSYTSDATSVAVTRKEQENLQKKGIIVPCLEDAPDVPTVVVISGRLRAGKVVPKKHIHFIWEGAEKSKTDALVQGLPGRMCGYEFGDVKPYIFVPITSLERKSNKTVAESEVERHLKMPFTIPRNGTNLKKSALDTKPDNGMTACPPIQIILPFEDEELYSGIFDVDDDTIRGENCRDILLDNLDLIHSAPFLTQAQKDEILGFVYTAPARVRNIRQRNAEAHHNVLREVIKAYESKTTAPNHIVSQHDHLNFIITHPCLQTIPGANSRHLYVVFYTKSSAGEKLMEVSHLKSRIPETNGKSIFSVNTKDVPRDFVAAGLVTIPTSLVQTPSDLKKTLHEYIQMWSNAERVDMSSRIQSDKDRFVLKKKTFNYKTSKKNDVEVIRKELETLFGIKVKVSYTRSGADTFNIKEISWE